VTCANTLGLAEYLVRTLYAFDGQQAEDFSASCSWRFLAYCLLTPFTAFGENLMVNAYPSKTGGEWWYGTVVNNGKTGFCPKTYVQVFKAGRSPLCILPSLF
jgi:hypothetical protein